MPTLFADLAPGSAPLTEEQKIAGQVPWGGMDFMQFYVCGRLIREGKNPYDLPLAETMQKKLGRAPLQTYNPPTSLLWYYPFSSLNFPAAVRVNAAVNYLLLLGSLLLWIKILPPGQSWIMLLAAGHVWLSDLDVVAMGQNTLWVLAGFSGWLWAVQHQRPVLAGILLSLVIIKPHLGVLMALFAILQAFRSRQWSVPLAFAAVVASWCAGAELLRPGIWQEYVWAWRNLPLPSAFYSATLNGWGRWCFGSWFAGMAGLMSLGIMWFVIWLGLKINVVPDRPRLTPLIAVLALCATPHAMSYDFVLLLPGFLGAVSIYLAAHRKADLAILLGWLILDGWLVFGSFSTLHERNFWWVPWAAWVLLGIQFAATQPRQAGVSTGSMAVHPNPPKSEMK